ncbi:MAG TPA: hypothetical protein VFN13_11625, partial [Rudaea sp.]|nr:hypothetical protein [Rudaea sp.]
MKKPLLALLSLSAFCAFAARADPNLLPNGDFSHSNQLSGWTAIDAGLAPITYDAEVDANGNPDSGSMLINGLQDAASACFAVSPGKLYSFGGQSTAAHYGFSALFSYMRCTTYPSTDCSGPGRQLSDSVNLWGAGSDNGYGFSQGASQAATLPADARSATCSVNNEIYGEFLGTVSNHVDNLFFESAPPDAAVTVDGYMSGSWYDPAQSGHGFDLQITDQQDLMLAYWYTFAPDGSGQVWIYAQGPYDVGKNTVTLPAEILTGAKFPPLFNSNDLQGTPWGTITFSFTDCNHGTASWNSTVPGYGSG